MAPYLQILFGMTVLAAIYSIFKSFVFNVHMFQLNSYRFSTHINWLKKNTGRYLIELAVFILSFTGFIKSEPHMRFAASALFICVLALAPENRAKQYKKPLVYTPRVKRLLATFLLLMLVSFSASIFCLTTDSKNLAFLVLGLAAALAPVYILAANLINRPIEKGINRHYLNEAKKMLADSPQLEIVGITGSYGKTSVKFFLYDILRAWIDTLVTPESYNTPMGIVKTIRASLTAVHKVFLCEMGAKWVGDIKELCDIVRPKHGIITALGEQHLETFGSRENIIKTKYELAEALPENGRLYINYDNEIIRKNPPKRPFITYGMLKDCDYRAFDIAFTPEGARFTLKTPKGEEERFETKLLGEHNIVNLTGAIAAAHGFGMSLAEMKPYIRRIEAVPHRMQIVSKGDITFIDDSFNSNPAGCRAALSALGKMDGMKILVTPGMVELGRDSEKLNSEFGTLAAKYCDKIILVGEKQTLAIKNGVIKAGFNRENLLVFNVFTDAMEAVYSIKSDKKKIVLLENDLPDNY